MSNPFETGVVIFFRCFDERNLQLARSVHLDGRSVEIRSETGHPEDYIVLDKNDKIVGIYPRDWVAAIMPLQTVGPAHALDQQTRRDSAPSSTEGDPNRVPERAKGLDS